MNSNYKIKELGAGSKFTYGGVSWVLLQKTKTAALCLAEKVLFCKAFDDCGNNNWEESNLRKHLNSEFLDALAANLGSGADKAAFLPFTADLTADDGLKGYSETTDKISLMTCDQYRKWCYIIPPTDKWWWTATALGIPNTGGYRGVIGVRTSGMPSHNDASRACGGVRPICNLNASTVVTVTDLKNYTKDDEAEENELSADSPTAANSGYSKHKKLCDHLHDTYTAKNKDYGNSFGDMFAEFGIITAITRIGDKFNRIKALVKNGNAAVKEESIRDTLLDMANYCIMTVIEIGQ